MIQAKRLTAQGRILPLQRKPVDGVEPTPPSAHSQDPTTSLVKDAYESGSLNEQQWRAHVAAARSAGDENVKRREYELLFSDVARMAKASTVLGNDEINWLAGAKPKDNKTYRPGLNLTPYGSSDLGASGKTGFVNAKGEFDVAPTLEPGVEVAIVLTVELVNHGKESPLATLRHEMMHAVHLSETMVALRLFQADAKKDTSKDRKDLPRAQFNHWIEQQQKRGNYSPVDVALIEESAQTSKVAGSPNSELLAYFEGFMTRFHLTKPPIEMNDPAFIGLLGALESPGPLFPWRMADKAVRAEALGRFRQYCLEELDEPHRRALQEWVSFMLAKEQADRGPVDEKTLGNLEAANAAMKSREVQMYAHFFSSLQEMLKKMPKTATPMALPGR